MMPDDADAKQHHYPYRPTSRSDSSWRPPHYLPINYCETTGCEQGLAVFEAHHQHLRHAQQARSVPYITPPRAGCQADRVSGKFPFSLPLCRARTRFHQSPCESKASIHDINVIVSCSASPSPEHQTDFCVFLRVTNPTLRCTRAQGERHDPDVATDGSGFPGGGKGGGNGGSGGGGGLAYVLTDMNTLLRLRERDTPSKLELLFRKNLYPMAISLAYASDHDVSEILGIYRE